jgi:hypothetical protein
MWGAYLLLSLGIWALYHAWRNVIPVSDDPWEKNKGQSMRRGQRLIFFVGGLLLTFFGLLIVYAEIEK